MIPATARDRKGVPVGRGAPGRRRRSTACGRSRSTRGAAGPWRGSPPRLRRPSPRPRGAGRRQRGRRRRVGRAIGRGGRARKGSEEREGCNGWLRGERTGREVGGVGRGWGAGPSTAPAPQPGPQAPPLAAGAPGVQGEAHRLAAPARGGLAFDLDLASCRRRADLPEGGTLPCRRHRGRRPPTAVGAPAQRSTRAGKAARVFMPCLHRRSSSRALMFV